MNVEFVLGAAGNDDLQSHDEDCRPDGRDECRRDEWRDIGESWAGPLEQAFLLGRPSKSSSPSLLARNTAAETSSFTSLIVIR